MGLFTKPLFLQPFFGELAQLARALAWHARGRRFDSDILHALKVRSNAGLFLFCEIYLNTWLDRLLPRKHSGKMLSVPTPIFSKNESRIKYKFY